MRSVSPKAIRARVETSTLCLIALYGKCDRHLRNRPSYDLRNFPNIVGLPPHYLLSTHLSLLGSSHQVCDLRSFLEPTATGATKPSDRRQPSLPTRRCARRIWVDPCAPQRTVTRILRNDKGASHSLVAEIGAPFVGDTPFGPDDGRVGIETTADLVGTGATERGKFPCQMEGDQGKIHEGLTS